jgi:hypothetical protein
MTDFRSEAPKWLGARIAEDATEIKKKRLEFESPIRDDTHLALEARPPHPPCLFHRHGDLSPKYGGEV